MDIHHLAIDINTIDDVPLVQDFKVDLVAEKELVVKWEKIQESISGATEED